MKLETSILQDICDQIATEIDAVVTIFGSRGKIIASSKRSRIGSFMTEPPGSWPANSTHSR
jgi:sugar diacid utilization regulator